MVLCRMIEPPDLLVTTITGLLTADDQCEFVAWVRAHIRSVGAVRVLVCLDHFAGWKPGALDDPAGWLRDDEPITRMAIVGEPQWRLPVLTAMAQPVRRTRIAYFELETEAREWLARRVERSASITT